MKTTQGGEREEQHEDNQGEEREEKQEDYSERETRGET